MLTSAQITQGNEDFQKDTIVRSFDYDIGIEAERVNFWSTGEIFGESGFYGQIPISQTSASNNIISFSAIIKNYGTVAATPLLNISVRNDDDDEIYSQTVTLSNELAPGESDTITTQSPYFDLEDYHQFGFIKFDFSCSIDGNIDENLENNFKSDSTKITSDTYARDNNNVTGDISTCAFLEKCNNGDAIGVSYVLNMSKGIESVDIWISETTPIGSLFVPKLLVRDEETNDWVEIASGTIFIISDEDLGEFKSYPLIDYCYVPVPNNELVEILVAIECYYDSEPSSLVFGIDQTTPTNGFENWIKLGDENIWMPFESNFSPIIRMTLAWDFSVSNDYSEDLCLFPNPTSGKIQFENYQTQLVEVLNIDGQIVKTCKLNDNDSQIDLSELENGSYFLKILVGHEFIVKKVILIK